MNLKILSVNSGVADGTNNSRSHARVQFLEKEVKNSRDDEPGRIPWDLLSIIT